MLNKKWRIFPVKLLTINHLNQGKMGIFLPRTSPCCTGIHHASPAALRRNVVRYGSKWGLPFRVSKRGPLLCAPKEDDKATKSYNIHFHRFPPMVF